MSSDTENLPAETPHEAEAPPTPKSHSKLDQIKGKGERTRNQEAKYLTVRTNCISCKRKLSARIDMLHAKLKCPKCGMRMHLGRDGEWREGPRPPDQEYDPYTDSSKEFKRPAWWRQTKVGKFLILHWRRAALVSMGACLIALAAVAVRDASEIPLPEPLEQRTQLAIDAALRGDDKTLTRLTAGDTLSDAHDWSRQLRKDVGKTATAKSSVIVADLKKGQGTTMANITIPGKRNKEVLLHWKLDGRHMWRLDGTRTHREK